MLVLSDVLSHLSPRLFCTLKNHHFLTLLECSTPGPPEVYWQNAVKNKLDFYFWFDFVLFIFHYQWPSDDLRNGIS